MNRKSQRAFCGLFASTICCLAGVSAFAQAPAPPPVKMGLWESSSTMTMGGFQIPPDVVAKMQAMGRPVPGAPHTTVTQSCMTADEWTKTWANLNKRGDMECKVSDLSQDSQKLSFDSSCTSQRGGAFTGHFEMFFDDDEHTHGSMHMKGEGGSGGQPMVMDMKMTSHFVSADCGEVKPGGAKVIKTE
jgi:hypothetical protein